MAMLMVDKYCPLTTTYEEPELVTKGDDNWHQRPLAVMYEETYHIEMRVGLLIKPKG
jgi:hypothetical protein